jgi:TetR/AcrR family transcriptional repressor of nem operon
METNSTKKELLDAASLLVQTRGYNGFSFHDLAAAVGITTASIHYHFPTKATLGQQLVKRYTAEFMGALGDPQASSPSQRLRHYVLLFRAALSGGRMCLCGMIGAEVDGVPTEVSAEVREFFRANELWLMRVFERAGAHTATARGKARLFVSALEGAMLIARASGDAGSFDDVAKTAFAICGMSGRR